MPSYAKYGKSPKSVGAPAYAGYRTGENEGRRSYFTGFADYIEGKQQWREIGVRLIFELLGALIVVAFFGMSYDAASVFPAGMRLVFPALVTAFTVFLLMMLIKRTTLNAYILGNGVIGDATAGRVGIIVAVLILTAQLVGAIIGASILYGLGITIGVIADVDVEPTVYSPDSTAGWFFLTGSMGGLFTTLVITHAVTQMLAYNNGDGTVYSPTDGESTMGGGYGNILTTTFAASSVSGIASFVGSTVFSAYGVIAVDVTLLTGLMLSDHFSSTTANLLVDVGYNARATSLYFGVFCAAIVAGLISRLLLWVQSSALRMDQEKLSTMRV